MFGILRTILAIFVVLLHVFSIPKLGNYAVTFFFILSGFLMTLIMHKTYKYNFRGFTYFWSNRILRLYPTYLLILILSLFIILISNKNQLNPSMYLPTSIKEWFSNISMIYFDIVPHKVKPRVVPTSWALTNELFFYFLISLGISKTLKRTLFWLGLSILYYVGTYYFYDIATYRYSAIPASSLPFSIGAVLFWVKNIRFVNSGFTQNVIFISTLTLLFFFNVIYVADSGIVFFSEMAIYINYILASCLIIILFKININTKLKRLDTYIGYFSYPIYLSHYLISALYIYFFKTNYNSFKLDFEDFLFYFLALILFSFFIVHLIDIKIDNLKKRMKEQQLNNCI
jgi:peptidoglycan/LPS O-acetylase OafA/YrhL